MTKFYAHLFSPCKGQAPPPPAPKLKSEPASVRRLLPPPPAPFTFISTEDFFGLASKIGSTKLYPHYPAFLVSIITKVLFKRIIFGKGCPPPPPSYSFTDSFNEWLHIPVERTLFPSENAKCNFTHFFCSASYPPPPPPAPFFQPRAPTFLTIRLRCASRRLSGPIFYAGPASNNFFLSLNCDKRTTVARPFMGRKKKKKKEENM